MKNITLSVCIATYNRAQYIEETIDSILPQLSDSMELVVLDGNSTDSTPEIMNRYCLSDNRIRYIRESQKGGVDQDYCKAAEAALGEYIWLMTDDDVLSPDAIAKIASYLEKKPSLVIADAERRNNDLSRVITAKMLAIDSEVILEPGEFEKLFILAADRLTFIGGVVIRKEVWTAREKKKYFGTEFIHIGVIFQEPLPGRAIIIPEVLISMRYGHANWTGRPLEVWWLQWPELVWSFKHFSEAAKASVVPRFPWKSPAKVLSFRALGYFSHREYNRLRKTFRLSKKEKLHLQLIAGLPGLLANFAALVYYFFIRKSRLVCYDLLRCPHCIFGNFIIKKFPGN